MIASGPSHVITGAGISCDPPAELPIGNTLRNDVLSVCLEATYEEAPGALSDDAQRNLMESDWKLEFVLGRLHRAIGELAVAVIKTLQVVLPNESHMQSALLLADGGMHATFNFDEGIEFGLALIRGRRVLPQEAPRQFREALETWRAAAPALRPVHIVAREKAFQQWALGEASGREPAAALFKLHGSLQVLGQSAYHIVEPVIIDDLAVQEVSSSRLRVLDALASGELLITGYGGNDLDFYDPLRARLRPGGFDWIAPSVPRVVAEDLRSIDPDQPTRGFAGDGFSAIRDFPDWPREAIADPVYPKLFSQWRADALRHCPALAEATASLLLDVRRYDEAIEILERLTRSNPPRRTWLRLGDALNHRNVGPDKRRSAFVFRRATFMRGRSAGERTYALARWAEANRSLAIESDTVRVEYALLALVGAIAAYALSWVDSSDRARRGDILASLGHLLLRVVEVELAAPARGRRSRRVLRGIAFVAAAAFRLAGRAKPHDPQYVRLQSIEVAALRALLERRAFDQAPSEARLADVERTYRRLPNPRGVANAVAARALVALASRDVDRARSLLDDALQKYRYPNGTIDPSGIRLIERRRRLLEWAQL